MPLGVGQEFAGFTIVGRLGAGGMGEVYLAQHPRLPRRDALKVLRAEAPTDTRYRDRFLREADAAAKLWHPHIVGVHDRGECDGRLWISMDFVDGEDAASLLNRCYPAGMPVDLVAAIATAVASALDYSHRQGLLHRDVKPANIVIANADDPAQRRILLTDFGIAREIEDVSGLTETNMTVGTFAYSAPEQLMGGAIDGRADQYALAATTYHLLAGDTLFAGTSPAAVIGNHLHSPPPQLSDSRPDFAALDHVMTAALAKEPSDRFPLCSDFARAFAEQASGAPGPSAPTALAPAPRARPAVAPEPAVLVAAREKTPRFGQPALAGLGVVALVLAGVIGSLLSRGGGDGRDRQAGPAATAEQPGTAARDSRPGTVTETATRTVARPPDTVTLAPTPVRPSPQNGRGEGDLGLAVPISSPPCDGLGVVIVYSATNPKSYGRAVQLALNAHPGASYLRTDQSCPSLKKSSGGEAIYAVYIPAGYSKSSVCAVVRQVGGDAYGRWLDTALSPDHEINC